MSIKKITDMLMGLVVLQVLEFFIKDEFALKALSCSILAWASTIAIFAIISLFWRSK